MDANGINEEDTFTRIKNHDLPKYDDIRRWTKIVPAINTEKVIEVNGEKCYPINGMEFHQHSIMYNVDENGVTETGRYCNIVVLNTKEMAALKTIFSEYFTYSKDDPDE